MITMKRALFAVNMKKEINECFDCGAVTHFNRKKSKETFYPPEEEDD